MAQLKHVIRIIGSLATVVALASATPGTGQTLLDQFVRKALPHPVARPATAMRMPGTALLHDTPNVAGITLGMSFADVTTAMAGKPLALVTTEKLPVRAERIRAAVNSRLGTPVKPRSDRATDEVARLGYRSADGQTLAVTFGDGAAGRVVTGVRYHIDAATITRERFVAQLAARYGPIPVEYDSSSYCTSGDRKCDWMGQQDELPAVTVDWAINAYSVSLTEGSRTRAERLKPFEAEVLGRAPQTAAETRATAF